MRIGQIRSAGLAVGMAAAMAPAFSDDSLEPPGPPSATMKSLDEIWERLGHLESQNAALADMVSAQQAQLANLNLLSATSADYAWISEMVDDSNNVGENVSLAIGPDGHPAVSYYDEEDGNLMFARHDGQEWYTNVIDDGEDSGRFNSLAFGPEGEPAIAYRDDANESLKFASQGGGKWGTVTVDDFLNVGTHVSLAFGPDGNPAIAYRDASNKALRFAEAAGDAWDIDVIDSDDVTERMTTLVFAPDGRPVVVYNKGEVTEFIALAEFVEGEWSTRSLVSGVEGPGSLDFRSDGWPSVVYVSDIAGHLRIIRFIQDGLIASEVDEETEEIGLRLSLVYGLNGLPVVAYPNRGNRTLRLAMLDGEEWHYEVVDRWASTGDYPSLAVGPDGRLAVAHLRDTFRGRQLRVSRQGFFNP